MQNVLIKIANVKNHAVRAENVFFNLDSVARMSYINLYRIVKV